MLFMKKNKNARLKTSQRQKLSRRQIIIISAACIAFMCIGITIFINLSDVKSSKASVNHAVSVYEVGEPAYIDSKEIDAPVVIEMPVTDAHTVFVQKAKALKKEDHPSSK